MSGPDGQSALDTLRWHYENRTASALRANCEGTVVVGYTSNTVPWELIRGAGFFPLLLSPARAPETPRADVLMEPVFDGRLRTLFDQVLGGEWSFLSLLVIPRTSEPENKLFLYLTEAGRQGLGDRIPPVYLYDLLHTRSVRSRAYGLERTRALKLWLEQIAGRPAETSALVAAVAESNEARRAARALLSLRRGSSPRLKGVEALQAVGAFYFMDRKEFARLATTAAAELARRDPLRGPRLLLKGTPLDRTLVHRALESQDAVVVAEDDWWGSRAAGRDVSLRPDPLSGIFAKYYLDAPSPRVFPPEVSDRWFRREALRSIEGVVFHLPAEDDVYGWDYPRQLSFLREHGIPSLLLRDVPGTGEDLSAEGSDRVAAFVDELKRSRRD